MIASWVILGWRAPQARVGQGGRVPLASTDGLGLGGARRPGLGRTHRRRRRQAPWPAAGTPTGRCVPFPPARPQETFATYRASGGYGAEAKLVAALERWGPNKFEVGCLQRGVTSLSSPPRALRGDAVARDVLLWPGMRARHSRTRLARSAALPAPPTSPPPPAPHPARSPRPATPPRCRCPRSGSCCGSSCWRPSSASRWALGARALGAAWAARAAVGRLTRAPVCLGGSSCCGAPLLLLLGAGCALHGLAGASFCCPVVPAPAPPLPPLPDASPAPPGLLCGPLGAGRLLVRASPVGPAWRPPLVLQPMPAHSPISCPATEPLASTARHPPTPCPRPGPTRSPPWPDLASPRLTVPSGPHPLTSCPPHPGTTRSSPWSCSSPLSAPWWGSACATCPTCAACRRPSRCAVRRGGRAAGGGRRAAAGRRQRAQAEALAAWLLRAQPWHLVCCPAIPLQPRNPPASAPAPTHPPRSP